MALALMYVCPFGVGFVVAVGIVRLSSCHAYFDLGVVMYAIRL